jgi:hypothetical protein
MDEVLSQFVKHYGKENVLWAETQEEFEEICDVDDEYQVVCLDTFLFFDLLTPDNIYKIKNLEKYFTYIVFVGKDIMELNRRIRKL